MNEYVLFGAGSVGKYIHDRLEREGKRVVCFADSHKEGFFLGKPVTSPKFAALSHPDAIWIPCAASAPEMIETMRTLGVKLVGAFEVLNPPSIDLSEPPLARALSTDGFMDRDELEYLMSAAGRSKTIAEIGSWMGRSSIAIAGSTAGTVYCIDKWKFTGSDMLKVFQMNTAGLPVIAVQKDSLDAARDFAEREMRFDMIFIDGDHTSPAVDEDIRAWRELLTPYGILCGHDYATEEWPDVKTAVDALVGPVRVINRIWTTEGA